MDTSPEVLGMEEHLQWQSLSDPSADSHTTLSHSDTATSVVRGGTCPLAVTHSNTVTPVTTTDTVTPDMSSNTGPLFVTDTGTATPVVVSDNTGPHAVTTIDTMKSFISTDTVTPVTTTDTMTPVTTTDTMTPVTTIKTVLPLVPVDTVTPMVPLHTVVSPSPSHTAESLRLTDSQSSCQAEQQETSPDKDLAPMLTVLHTLPDPQCAVRGVIIRAPDGEEYDLSRCHLVEKTSSGVEMVVKEEMEEEEEEDKRQVEGWTECEVMEEEEEGGWGERGCQDVVVRWREEGREEKGDGGCAGEVMVEAGSSCNMAGSRWSHADTLKLIQLYKENRHYFADKHNKKKTVWAMLAGKMARGSNKSKVKFTSIQVYNRWKNLTKTYRDCLRKIRRAGPWVGRCRFFEEMASVYDAGASQQPKSGVHRAARKHRQGGATGPANRLAQCKSKWRAIAPKVKATVVVKPDVDPCSFPPQTFLHAGGEEVGGGGGLEAVVRAVQELHDKEKALDQWKMDRLQQMHTEKMQMFAQFLDVLKDLKK
ncbi:uncharacterized protein LOC143300674 [Babylonia areolata]|uniref:uncharacterized protein LOC143300674 n=1 Tax=Babylonia areolata TaxID=304850 RepID=UPI003FD05944